MKTLTKKEHEVLKETIEKAKELVREMEALDLAESIDNSKLWDLKCDVSSIDAGIYNIHYGVYLDQAVQS